MPFTFVDDEYGYETWLHAHPGGFVVNCDRNPKANYLMLHRVSCHSISGAPSRGDAWTIAYMKVCADSPTELEAWARAETGSDVQRCAACVP